MKAKAVSATELKTRPRKGAEADLGLGKSLKHLVAALLLGALFRVLGMFASLERGFTNNRLVFPQALCL